MSQTERPATVLVADDEPDILAILSEILAHGGYRVRTATDGAEALAAAERDPPDLILADVAMPGLDGVALRARLRAKGFTAPVVLTSANYTPEDWAAVPAFAGIPFVAKPFDISEVLDAVARALGRTTAPAPPHRPRRGPARVPGAVPVVPRRRAGLDRPERVLPVDGTRLAEARRAAGLSQRALAETVGLSHTIVARLERGEARSTNPAVVRRMAAVLGVELEDLAAATN